MQIYLQCCDILSHKFGIEYLQQKLIVSNVRIEN